MKKFVTTLFSICLLSLPLISSDFMKDKVIEKVRKHSVAIAVYYTMKASEYQRRQRLTYPNLPILIKTVKKSEREYTIAYIGAGYIAHNNFVVTVDHLFGHDTNAYDRKIWVFVQGLDHPVAATLTARTNMYPSPTVQTNDYAVIHMNEQLYYPGLELAKKDIKPGSKAMYVGSTGGFAFFPRFGYTTEIKHFFRRDREGRLRLSFWENFAYITVYPGGAGDSGGVIVNKKGQVVGIMYCGVRNNEESYIFSNPLRYLKKFIKDNRLSLVIK